MVSYIRSRLHLGVIFPSSTSRRWSHFRKRVSTWRYTRSSIAGLVIGYWFLSYRTGGGRECYVKRTDDDGRRSRSGMLKIEWEWLRDRTDLLEFIHHVFNVDNEALPQAPAPAEVAHPAPDQNERAALLRDIHTLIREQLREYCARGKGGLAHSPEMLELYSSSAKAIMSYDLDIPAETDTETPRRWVGEYKGGP